jgi:hypothetical protein
MYVGVLLLACILSLVLSLAVIHEQGGAGSKLGQVQPRRAH